MWIIIFLSYYFINLSKVFPRPCTQEFLSPVDASLGQSASFDLQLTRAALLGLVGKRLLLT